MNIIDSQLAIHLENGFGITQLHRACYLSDLEMVKNTIKRGADVNAKVNFDSPYWQGFTPLHCTALTVFKPSEEKKFIDRMTKIVELLLKHGADPLLVDDNNETCLHVVKKLNCIDQFSLINKMFSFTSSVFARMKNFNVNPTNKQGFSLFHIACLTQDKFAIKKFLKYDVDVNQAISINSDFCPSSTPIQLVLKFYQLLHSCSSNFTVSDKDILQVLDLLIQKNANVNKADYFGDTPLFEAVKSKKLRLTLMQKLISNGANINATNGYGNTAFELLLKQKDVSRKEIELFLNADFLLHVHYNRDTGEGFLIEFFRFQREYEIKLATVMESEFWKKIVNNPEIIKIQNTGRNAIHNVVSNDDRDIYTTVEVHTLYKPCDFDLRRPKKRIRRNGKPIFYKEFYEEIIEQFLIRGCDIDLQDEEGDTALHLAVQFDNLPAIQELLKHGADINIVDKDGKTAFVYCRPMYYSDPRVEEFINHIRKLEFFGYYVNEQNKQFQQEVLQENYFKVENFRWFHREIEITKAKKIGTTSISLYDFLINTNDKMTSQERLEVERFIKNISDHKFYEIGCLFKFKYRQTFDFIKLFEPALASLKILMKYQMPDLCCRNILKFLNNPAMKCLIASIPSTVL